LYLSAFFLFSECNGPVLPISPNTIISPITSYFAYIKVVNAFQVLEIITENGSAVVDR